MLDLPAMWSRLTRRRPTGGAAWPDDGIDYTGWAARWLHDDAALLAGAQGVVVGFEQCPRGKFWTIAFPGKSAEQVDVFTPLPQSEDVELIPPAGR